MNERNYSITSAFLVVGSLIALNGCSSPLGKGDISGQDIARNGPAVLNVHTYPATVELTRKLQPVQKPEIVADVKDFGASISKVTLKFNHVPIQIPMKNIGGTTWRAELSNEQIKTLAVSGKTINYDATVEATDTKGLMGVSSSPVTVAIKTPSMTRTVS